MVMDGLDLPYDHLEHLKLGACAMTFINITIGAACLAVWTPQIAVESRQNFDDLFFIQIDQDSIPRRLQIQSQNIGSLAGILWIGENTPTTTVPKLDAVLAQDPLHLMV